MVHDMSLPLGDRDEHPAMPFDEMTLKQHATIISQVAIWLNAELHGWHNPSNTLAEDLLLIHSEISEACEAARAGNLLYDTQDHSVEEELADAVIRIFHTAEKNGMDICEAVRRKHEKNIKRPYRHGNKKF